MTTHSWERSFPVRRVPDRAVYLGPYGPARRWWWGRFIFSLYPNGRLLGHVHRPALGRGCCGVGAEINAGDWR